MELAALLEERSLHLDLAWIPRSANSEADRLADGDYENFQPELRVGRELSDVPFVVLPGLLEEGLAWHESLLRRQVADRGAQPVARPPGPKRLRLREREPW